MTNIWMDLWADDTQTHPQLQMRGLGINYADCKAYPMYDGWAFFDCENVPSDLPKHIAVLNDKAACILRGTND